MPCFNSKRERAKQKENKCTKVFRELKPSNAQIKNRNKKKKTHTQVRNSRETRIGKETITIILIMIFYRLFAERDYVTHDSLLV
jgi:hypothetical protein